MSDTLFSPTGVEVPAGTPTESLRLRSRGYSATRPFVPGEHTVPEVVEHISAHPDEAARVKATESATRARKGVVEA